MGSFAKKLLRFIRRLMSNHPARFISLSYVFIFFIGALLLNMPFVTHTGERIGFIKAFFTSVSITCITGLSVVDTNIYWSVWGKIIILCLIQIGGLGFMSLATLVSLVFRRGIGLKERHLLAESVHTSNMSGIVRLVRRVLLGTLMIEGAGAVLLAGRFIPEYGFLKGLFKGIFLSVSAFCNAGVDILGKGEPFMSLTRYAEDITINLVVMLLVIIGGIGFLVWEDLCTVKNPKKWRLSTKLTLSITGSLIVGGFLLFLLMEWSNPETLGRYPFFEKILPAMFMSVSPRTAGFHTVNLNDMNISSQIVMIILMFIGGSPGSTAGGIKTTAFGVMVFTLISVIKGQDYIHAFKRRITYGTMMRSVTIFILALLVVFTGTFFVITVENITGFDQLEPLHALFEVTSAFSTTGFTMGITPHLTGASLLSLAGIMFIGRVGIFTIMLSLMIKRANLDTNYRYPEERILI